MLISFYSFTALAQRAEKLMTNGGSLLTLTYYGAEKLMPHYNVMGVAKAALESVGALSRRRSRHQGHPRERDFGGPDQDAGSVGHRATSATSCSWNEHNAPLRRNVTTEEVGESALYLLSDLSRGVTGEIHHVDAGYHVVGMKHEDAPDLTVSKE